MKNYPKLKNIAIGQLSDSEFITVKHSKQLLADLFARDYLVQNAYYKKFTFNIDMKRVGNSKLQLNYTKINTILGSYRRRKKIALKESINSCVLRNKFTLCSRLNLTFYNFVVDAINDYEKQF